MFFLDLDIRLYHSIYLEYLEVIDNRVLNSTYFHRFEIVLLIAFTCMRWSENKKYKKKKICVPRQCDTDYGCPYPFQCDNKKCSVNEIHRTKNSKLA